jgi:hypothetical protein
MSLRRINKAMRKVERDGLRAKLGRKERLVTLRHMDLLSEEMDRELGA